MPVERSHEQKLSRPGMASRPSRQPRPERLLLSAIGLMLGAGFSVETTPLLADPAPVAAPPPLLQTIPVDALNVRNFGAKGDGTTSDRHAIQEALGHASPGDTIYFPAGTYYLDEPISVLKSNLTFWGDGPQSVLKGTLSRPAVLLGSTGEPLTGLVIRRLAFLGVPGKYKIDGNGGGGIQIFGPKGTLITDCDFIGNGFAVNNVGTVGTTYGTRIENCRVNGWGTVAIFCNGGEQVLNCQLVQDDPDLKDEHSSHGFYIHSGCTDVLIADTLIQNARKYAAQVYGQDENTTTQRITFRNVTIKDCANGLTIQQGDATAARAKDILIEGCTITGTYDGPALSVKQGDGIQITKNVLDGGSIGLQLGVWAPYEPGFSINNLVASDNTIRHFDQGIYALASNGGTFTNVILSGNVITDCREALEIGDTPGITVNP